MSVETVKASVLHGVKDLRVEERSLPPPSADEVQIAVQSTGLCGSDLHYYGQFRNGDILVREPLTLGHESSGTVVAVGSAVTALQQGDRVALEVGMPCEDCEYCNSGRYNICKGMKFRSSAKSFPHVQGTLQERINHPARWVHKLPEAISQDLGALVEPLSVAMHAHRRANVSRGSSVLVFGAGAVGLVCATVSKANDAAAVIIADIQKDRVDFAVNNGFADAGFVVPVARPQSIDDKLVYAQKVAQQAKSVKVNDKEIGEVGAVYECTGVESCVQSAIYAAKPGGKVIIIGMGTPILTLPLSAAALREVDLVGVFRYANTYSAAIEMLCKKPAGLPDVRKIVTHRFKGLDEVQNAFEMAGKVKDEEGNLVLKVIVDMS
ncbi:hypothetical protein Trco_003453 [Trichoderma cornu-damae]|uniref:Enoyl reductase (ER) domain-containing protein n=1 Tax=Trichoderma cornu-damae TaxID=654480 RepID=A0A9P8QPD9_9HYPO|nr:hypothetical protein Trco_003453 [Trichoderma cornu-damae]